MTWGNPSPLALYHGTVDLSVPSILAGIDPTKGRAATDFARGFYTTTNLKQAENHARNQLYFRRGQGAKRAAIIEMPIDRDRIGVLNSMAFVTATADYWDLVDWCRAGNMSHTSAGFFDVVYGPVSSSLRKRTVYEGYDQVSFHTANGVNAIGSLKIRSVP